jgi:hypothetical protein
MLAYLHRRCKKASIRQPFLSLACFFTFYLTFVADCHLLYLTFGEIEGEEASKK